MDAAQQKVVARAALSTLKGVFTDNYKKGYAQGVHRTLQSSGILTDTLVGRASITAVTGWAEEVLRPRGTMFTVEVVVDNGGHVPTSLAVTAAVRQAVEGIRSIATGHICDVKRVLAQPGVPVTYQDGPFGPTNITRIE